MPIKNLDIIEEKLQLEKGTLKQAMESEEEQEIQIPDLVIKTKDDHDKFLSNFKQDIIKVNGAANEVAEKNAVKAASEKFGLDLEGKQKTVNVLAQALIDKVSAEAKVEPNEQIETLKQEKAQLQTNYKDLETSFNQFKEQKADESFQFTINQEILNHIPEGKTVIPKTDVLTVLRSKGLGARQENGTLIATINGQDQKNTTNLEPLPFSDVVSEMIKPYMKPNEGGRGGGDDTSGAHVGTVDQFIDQWQKDHPEKTVGGEEFNREMQKRMQEGTLKSS